jgi:hypothetical protein
MADLAKRAAEFLQSEAEGAPRPVAKPTRWHPADLVAAQFPDPEGFLLERVLCRQTVSLLAGWRGVGKTFISMKYGGCVAMNGIPLGHLTTRAGRVLFISQEMPEPGVRDRLRSLFSPAELEAMNKNFIIVCKEPDLRLDTAAGQLVLENLIDETGPDLVIIDALRFIKGAARERDNDEMGDVVLRLIDASVRRNVAILLLHHMGKPREDGFESGRGASAIEDLCSDVLYARKTDESGLRRVRFDKVRHLGEIDPFTYRIVRLETEECEKGAKAETVELSIGKAVEGSSSDNFEIRKAVEAVRKAGGEMSHTGLKEKMGWSKATAHRRLRTAKELNLLSDQKSGRSKLWRIPSDSNSEIPF